MRRAWNRCHGMQQRLSIAILSAALCSSAPACVAGDDAERTRAEFQQAYQAALAGNAARFRSLEPRLRDYVLHPYLKYAEMLGDIRNARTGQVEAFLERNAGQPLEWRLRDPWLRELARRGDWETFLAFHKPAADVTLRCHHAVARLRTGATDGLADDVLALWLTGQSAPDACDPAFDWLYRTGRIDQDARFERVALAMEAGNAGLAAWLARGLEGEPTVWYRRWREMTVSPEATLAAAVRWEDTATARRIARHGLRMLARGNRDARAWESWQRLDEALEFPADERGELIRHLALDAATDHHPDAQQRLAAVPDGHADASVRAWRVRIALRQQDWPAVLEAIAALPEDERGQNRWRYWRARALEATDRAGEAFQHYGALASEADYHGFLAADRLGRAYPLEDRAPEGDPELQRELSARPAMARALELHHVGFHLSARREWHHALAGAEAEALRQAALLAARNGWHDRAIQALAQTGDRGAYGLRFPLAHERTLRERAAEHRLAPEWVFGLVRAESGFIVDAHSPAGARGLMQMMPGTGRDLSRELGLPWSGAQGLSAPEINVHLGTRYLAGMLERFDGNVVLATAAYNAGPHRVDRWIGDNSPADPTVWAETIPFHETRDYIQRVLAYSVIYDWRLNGSPGRLSARLPTAPGALARACASLWPAAAACR